MDWVARFLERTGSLRCGVCGTTLARARVILRQDGDRWSADLRCLTCRTLTAVRVDAAA